MEIYKMLYAPLGCRHNLICHIYIVLALCLPQALLYRAPTRQARELYLSQIETKNITRKVCLTSCTAPAVRAMQMDARPITI